MTDIEYLIECNARDLVLLLMERQNLSMEEAFDVLYNSDTYSKLLDVNSGLYFQSPKYIYAYLHNEIVKGKML